MNLSLAREEWNHASGITSVCVGIERGEGVEERGRVLDGVRLVKKVRVLAVEKENSSMAHRMLEVSGETGGDDGG